MLCHFGIGCLQRGFMKNCSMMTLSTPRATTLATMIRHTTTMNMRRIIEVVMHNKEYLDVNRL